MVFILTKVLEMKGMVNFVPSVNFRKQKTYVLYSSFTRKDSGNEVGILFVSTTKKLLFINIGGIVITLSIRKKIILV